MNQVPVPRLLDDETLAVLREAIDLYDERHPAKRPSFLGQMVGLLDHIEALSLQRDAEALSDSAQAREAAAAAFFDAFIARIVAVFEAPHEGPKPTWPPTTSERRDEIQTDANRVVDAYLAIASPSARGDVRVSPEIPAAPDSSTKGPS